MRFLYCLPVLVLALWASSLETVHEFAPPMPTGVTVSRSGRIFVNYPRWGDPVDFTVGEIRNGKAAAYPDADTNQPEIPKQAERFISVDAKRITQRGPDQL